jgi:Methyltransferase domain
MRSSIFTKPRQVDDLTECYFYHTTDLPGIGKVEGEWDLRPNMKEYLGGVDFKDKRVLDVGCASGALSFYMEKQGATVVSFDLDANEDWDIVPFAKWNEFQSVSVAWKPHIRRINNAYWLAHRLLNSKAQVVNGNVYAIPEEIGMVDMTVYGSILLHLRDPFLALQSGARLAKEAVIVTEPYHGQLQPTTEPFLRLLPDARDVEPKMTWWDIRPEWVIRALGVLGFEDVQIFYHTQRNKIQDNAELYTAVGRRTHGKVEEVRVGI